MRALTVRQPWAWAIAAGHKRGARVPGHTALVAPGEARCRCGWSAPISTSRERKALYAVHLAEAREARRQRCDDCGQATARTQAWAAANPAAWDRFRRASHLRRRYGITLEQYDELLARQGGGCAICGTSPSDSRGYRMHVDHDHITGRVRGILCGPCNRGIGNLGDDPDRLEAAATYLRSAA